MRDRGRSNLKFFGAVLLAGGWVAAESAYGLESTEQAGPRMASLIHSSELLEQDELRAETVRADTTAEDKYWAFPSKKTSGPVLHLPAVMRLPPTSLHDDPSTTTESVPDSEPIASLLPPQAILASKPSVENALEKLDSLEPEAFVTGNESTVEELTTEEQQLVDAVIRDSRGVTTGVRTDRRIHQLAQAKIRRAYGMAGRGAYFAARRELIEVLQMISRSKDIKQGKAGRTLDLAAGLRALEEAADFAPRSTQLEANLTIDVICASHSTPVARQLRSQELLPREMMDCYFRYAQLKLAASVQDEPAGSMALHALGKLTSRLNRVEPEKHRLAHRHAVAFQQAALLAHNQNHLAAHELAVLLADSGHYAEAEQLLKQVVAREPNAIVYRNLARVQEKQGRTQLAASNRDYARQLIRQGVGGNNNVQWVSPQDFSRPGGNATRFASATPRRSAQPAPNVPAPAANWR